MSEQTKTYLNRRNDFFIPGFFIYTVKSGSLSTLDTVNPTSPDLNKSAENVFAKVGKNPLSELLCQVRMTDFPLCTASKTS